MTCGTLVKCTWLVGHLWDWTVYDWWDICEIYMTCETFVRLKCIWFVKQCETDLWDICEMYMTCGTFVGLKCIWRVKRILLVRYLCNVYVTFVRLTCGTFVKCVWLVGHLWNVYDLWDICESKLWWDICENVYDVWDICETDLYMTFETVWD